MTAVLDPFLRAHAQPNPGPAGLRDGFGRRFSYLRVSLTDRCNFRCSYCLPDGYRKQAGEPAELSPDELRRAVTAFARLGLWKLRLTGGEPTVRHDFTRIAADLARVPGIHRLALSTNGYRLASEAVAWRAAGIDAVNVSIDSLDRNAFRRQTGLDRLDEVVAGVDAAIAAGFASVKINSVLMRDTGEEDWQAVLGFVAQRPVAWRFIELMRTNDNAGFHAGQAMRSDALRARLETSGWEAQPRSEGAGPAIEYAHRDFAGRIGIIAPYADGFCDSCNRLRLSSRGKLHLCLFGEQGVDLRDLLQRDEDGDALVARIIAALPGKTVGHRLHEGLSGATPHLASIGG